MLDPSQFPLLLPQDDNGCIYDGYLNILNDEFRIKLTVPQNKDVCDVKIYSEWKLQIILDEYMPTIKQRLTCCQDLETFLKELIIVVESQHKMKESSVSSCVLTNHIVEELERIGWDKFKSIDTSFQNVVLEVPDGRDRKHLVKLQFDSQNPSGIPKCTTDLPYKFIFHWNRKEGVRQLLNQFEDTLKQYEEFWDEMDEIDANTWVLEPEQTSYSALYRRIVIGTNASLQISVDAKQPKVFPECIFLGADQIVNPLKEKLNQNLYQWDLNKSLLVNLETILEIAFPSPTNSKKEDFSVECGICYSYRLEEFIPDVVCEDKRCGQPFHHICLYEWLRSLPSIRQSFNTIYGECPFCSKSITVKMPQT